MAGYLTLARRIQKSSNPNPMAVPLCLCVAGAARNSAVGGNDGVGSRRGARLSAACHRKRNDTFEASSGCICVEDHCPLGQTVTQTQGLWTRKTL